MHHFFKKRGYPDSVVDTAQHCAQQIDRQSAQQTSQKEKNKRMPFTLTYHPHNLATKDIILKNFKLLQNDKETGRIFSQSPLISFKRDKNTIITLYNLNMKYAGNKNSARIVTLSDLGTPTHTQKEIPITRMIK